MPLREVGLEVGAVSHHPRPDLLVWRPQMLKDFEDLIYLLHNRDDIQTLPHSIGKKQAVSSL